MRRSTRAGWACSTSTGAWLLLRTRKQLETAGKRVTRFAVPELYQPLIDTMEPRHPHLAPKRRRGRSLEDILERMGRGTVHVLRQGYELLGFLGQITVETSEAVVSAAARAAVSRRSSITSKRPG